MAAAGATLAAVTAVDVTITADAAAMAAVTGADKGTGAGALWRGQWMNVAVREQSGRL